MMTATRPTFYQRFTMARQQVDPREYGVDLDRDEFVERMVEEFNAYTRGLLSFDEMLLRPRTALHFCDSVRQKFGWYDLPDDIILRVIMIRRKNPA